MKFQAAAVDEFDSIRTFYWDLIDAMKEQAAERLYTCMGFRFVQAKDMFYEDTGWTEYKIFEQNL